MTIRLGCTPASAVRGYLLRALGASATYDFVDIVGLPADVLVVSDRDLLLAVTPAQRASYRSNLKRVAAHHCADLLLLRIGRLDDGLINVRVDLALGAWPGTWVENDMRVWTDHSRCWLVPHGFGPSVSVSPAGLTLELVAPYDTQAQRTEGVERAALDVTRLADRIGAR